MPVIELAVIHNWPTRQIHHDSDQIAYTIRLDMPQVSENTSISSYLLQVNDGGILFWQPSRQQYGGINLQRPLSMLLSDAIQSLPQPLLLFVPRPDTDSTLLSHIMPTEITERIRSDDVHLLPSSHTGDTPPRLPFFQRLQGAEERAQPPRAAPSSNPFGNLESLGYISESDDNDDELMFDNDMLSSDDIEEEKEGISVTVSENRTSWHVILHRENKEAIFLEFLDRFCSPLEWLDDDTLPASVANIDIHLSYLGETGVGDGLVVEMLSYIWKHLFENTHHFVTSDKPVKGYCVPSDHTDTALKMSHLGLLAGVSFLYAVRPHDLHPMFFRSFDTLADLKNDALLFDDEACLFVPEDYNAFVYDREGLEEYWNHEFDFDRRVMPFARVTSKAIFTRIVQPEMFRCIVLPTSVSRRNLDVFRIYLFNFLDHHKTALARLKSSAHHFSTTTKEELLAMFHLSPEDKSNADAVMCMNIFQSILAEYSVLRIQHLMQHVTNKCYPTPVLVRFRESTYIWTCWSILQLLACEKSTMAEQLDIILDVMPNLPYQET